MQCERGVFEIHEVPGSATLFQCGIICAFYSGLFHCLRIVIEIGIVLVYSCSAQERKFLLLLTARFQFSSCGKGLSSAWLCCLFGFCFLKSMNKNL